MFFLTNNDILNVAAFTANHTGKVARDTTGGFSVGGMITQIVKHLNLVEERIIEGRSKVDMDSLVHQGMISMDGNTYTMMIRNKAILDLPNPIKVRIDIPNNRIYQMDVPSPGNSYEEEGKPNITNHHVGTVMEEDIIRPPTHPTQPEVGATNANQDRWEWLKSEIHGMKVEQTRKGMVLDDVQAMMQRLMLRFPPPEWGSCEFTLS